MRFFLTASFLGLALSSSLVNAEPELPDRVYLANGDLVTGKVLALRDTVIEVESPHATAPLKLKNQELVRLKFSEGHQEKMPSNSQQIFLQNGDSFPGKISGLNETHLSFETWFAGDLEIPREFIDSVQLGVTPQKTLYRGPDGLSRWNQSEENDWRFDNGSLTCRNRASIGRDFNLPENYIFSATLQWMNTPNMRILLGSSSPTINNNVGDCYLINLNSSGLQVRRSNTVGSPRNIGRGRVRQPQAREKVLLSHQTPISQLKPKKIDLELRVNRTKGNLQLYLNGEKLQRGIDPDGAPKGSCIIFDNQNSGQGGLIISNIVIQEWDTVTQRLHLEPRSSDDTDTLTVDDGDRYSGKVVSYDKESSEPSFEVVTPLSETPVQIPLANSSVLYFEKADVLPPNQGEYQLNLRSEGHLTLSGIELGKEKLSTTHPLLGALEIDRRVMLSISRGNPDTDK